MAVIQAFNAVSLLDTALSLSVAFVLGTLIGLERQYRQRTAGLRTSVLVAVGAAAFVDFGMRLVGPAGAVQVGAYVVSGVGFLGAGVIMKEGQNVRGLNTAATLWGSAAVGASAGADLIGEAALIAGAVLAGNTLLRPLVNFINRIPIDEQASEATYEIRIRVGEDDVGFARDLLTDVLDAAHYPVRDVEIERTGEEAELVATLVSTAVIASELDDVTARLSSDTRIQYATWMVSTVA